jgi:GntR family transcriptional repressor for pyruvate dehydrogenase complex
MSKSQYVLDYLLLQIDTGKWPENTLLPSERTLSEQLSVSRATIRDALSRLKSQNIVRSKQGSGHCVNAPQGPIRVQMGVEAHTKVAHQDLREYRYAIEAQSAFLAASRASTEQLRRLEKAHQHLRLAHQRKDLTAEGLADARFHLSIAEASGNRILSQSLQSLFSLLRANVAANISAMEKRPETRLRLMRQHTQLFEAIYYRKPEKARQIAQDHMDFVDRILKENASEELS